MKAKDAGPARDPIRQQGRDPKYHYRPAHWQASAQPCDRSRLACRRRAYHTSYFTSSGHTLDQLFEETAHAAWLFEDAGIDLGMGHVRHRCQEAAPYIERERRYAADYLPCGPIVAEFGDQGPMLMALRVKVAS